ncbi:hypothetical protein ACH4FX_37210 [Streptomyces sp. NPDC018019]|uniref:hypothetical protein n=1 Tax=Streptomyces sp. NPDC018019 TaxID=3365030 RepID=UPI0037AC9AA7
MSIISAALPLRPEALTNGVEDVVSEAWSVYEDVKSLARIGVDISVTVNPGTITADLTVSPQAVHLLPALIDELEDSGITRTPGGARILGTMCEGRVHLRITVDSAEITVDRIEALVASVDTDLDAVPADARTVAGWTA